MEKELVRTRGKYNKAPVSVNEFVAEGQFEFIEIDNDLGPSAVALTAVINFHLVVLTANILLAS